MKTPDKLPKTACEFEVPIYGGAVLVYKTAQSYRKARSYLGLVDDRDSMGGVCLHVENTGGEALYVIGVFNGLPSTLVHECGHLAMFILDRAGIDVRNDGGEAYCYLLGYLVAEMGIDKKKG